MYLHRLVRGLLLLLVGIACSAVQLPAQTSFLAGQEIWYHTSYPGGVAGAPGGMSALTGPTKMPVLFEAIVRQRLIGPGAIHTDSHLAEGRNRATPPIDLASLRAVHTDRYLKAILAGEPRWLATSQGLPTWTKEIARGWLLIVGGLAAAGETALRNKSITANLAHGYHHATADRGMGFCTINGLVVVAGKLIRESKARRVMIVDLDHHEGNGTAELVIGEPRIWNVSIYGSFMGGPAAAPNNHVLQVRHGDASVGVERDANYLAAIAMTLPSLVDRHGPDVILYQAGMDPYDGAGISPKALAIRDAYVFALSRARNIPVTWVLAGGYADLDTLVRLHTGTVRMANEVLARVNVKSRIEYRQTDPYTWSAQRDEIIFPDWISIAGGHARVSPPRSMAESEIREFAAAREQLYREQRLPEEEIAAAYRALLAHQPYR